VAFDLARLINPIDPGVFRRNYWEKQPLVVRRQNADYYRELLTLADVDRVLTSSSIIPSQFRVLREGRSIPIATSAAQGPTLEGLYRRYREGCTIVLQFLHERSRPLMRLCRSLASEFSAGFQTNVYLTPANEKGLGVHYDTHDVFVLQVEGVKHWQLFEGLIALPLPGQPYRQGGEESAELLAEFDLHPGDTIYIPRGYVHNAIAADSTSLHLTVGVQPITWAYVLLSAMESLIQSDPRYRESLPPGFATDEPAKTLAMGHFDRLLASMSERVEPAEVIANAVETALQRMQPTLEGHLLDLQGHHMITAETVLRRRPDIVWRLRTEDKVAYLRFHGKEVRIPAVAEPDLRFITQADEFSAVDLPGDLDEAGRMVLIRRLVREGFLTSCGGMDETHERVS
jgi:ribosomal protein L16 Arg81 hydroxylase